MIETERASVSGASTAFGHKVLQAVWSDKESHWDLVIEKDGQTIQDTCDVCVFALRLMHCQKMQCNSSRS